MRAEVAACVVGVPGFGASSDSWERERASESESRLAKRYGRLLLGRIPWRWQETTNRYNDTDDVNLLRVALERRSES